jgi:hypothetical protein
MRFPAEIGYGNYKANFGKEPNNRVLKSLYELGFRRFAVMPIENGVGYGEYTGVKIEHFGKILAMHMAITQAVIKKHASYYEP